MAALGVRLRDVQLAFPAMRDLVRLAERRGYDSVWLPESHGREVLTELTALALSSERIRLGTGIIPVFMHLPTVTAAAMATAAVVAPGRVMLGVGIGHQANLENGHGVHFHQPLQHVREFVTLVRRVFAEGQVSYHGEIYTIKHFQLETPPTQRVPVYIAALRPHMLQTRRCRRGWGVDELGLTGVHPQGDRVHSPGRRSCRTVTARRAHRFVCAHLRDG